MTSPLHFASVASLARTLGNAWDAANPWSFSQALERDELEQFPAQPCAMLEQWGLAAYYVPQEHGGKLGDYGETLGLLRALARRDLTVAVGHCKTFLGAAPIWLAGSELQKQELAATIRRGEPVALALTERAHGGDLLGSEVEAVSVEQGYRLSGEKWLINNATRSATMTVFARTQSAGGPRGFSLFLVRKSQLDPSSFQHLPKIRTLGIRGADISGIVFTNSVIASDALVGQEGAGLEILLKALQVTRTLVPGLSLGAADTALRTAMDFATSRKRHDGTVFDIPYAQALLARAFVDLLVCECLMLAGCRAIHVTPSRLSLWSAIIKYFVPCTIDNALRDLSNVLGARHYLRGPHAVGVFEKILRDHRIVAIFDGSSIVNLHLIAQQLRTLSRSRRAHRSEGRTAHASDLHRLFSFAAPLPAFAPGRLRLSCNGQDDALQGVDSTLATLQALGATRGVRAVEALKAHLAAFDRDLEAFVAAHGPGWEQSAEVFALSRRYCSLFAAAVCAHTWACNRAMAGSFFAQDLWLLLCVEHLLMGARPGAPPMPQTHRDTVAAELLALYQQNKVFSIAPEALDPCRGDARSAS